MFIDILRLPPVHLLPTTILVLSSPSESDMSDSAKCRIQYMSDLHLEIERTGSENDLFKFDFTKQANTLALLGDIGTTVDDRLFDWLNMQLARFPLVLFLAGNHEPYRSSLEESRKRLFSFAEKSLAAASTDDTLGHFVFLDRTRYDLSPNVTVLGCTLWSQLKSDDLHILKWSLNDFRRIEGLTPEVYQALHAHDLAWLEESVQKISQDEPNRRLVVMTHHAPTVEDTCDPKYIGGPTNSAFATEIIETAPWAKSVDVWLFGHTHWNCEFDREGVRVMCNQRGYSRGGEDGFNPDEVLEL